MDDGLFAPPVIWPIDPEHRQAILEGDIVIAHLVHARAFSRDAPGDPAIEMHQGNERSIHVRLDGKTYPLSHRFVYDVLYGFETVESCVSGIVDFAKQIAALNTSTLRIPKGERPCIRHVDSVAEAVALLSKPLTDGVTHVSMPTWLWESIVVTHGANASGTSSIQIYSGAGYCIVDWDAFVRTLSVHGT